MQPKRQRIGRYTVSVGLIALGAGLLLDNILGAWSALGWVLNLWPLIVIGFGLEYLVWAIIYERRGEQLSIRFDFLGAFLLILVLMVGVGVNTVRYVVNRLPEGVVLSELDYVEHTTTAAAGGASTLRLNVADGSVTVLPALGNGEVEVKSIFQHHAPFPVLLLGFEDSHWAEKVKPAEIRQEGDQVIVTALRDATPAKVWARYVVYVPAGMKVEMESESASVTVQNHIGDLNLKTRQGMLHVDNNSGALNLESINGMLEVSSHYGPVQVTSRTATVRLLGITGSVKAETESGYLLINNINGPLTAHNRNGNIQFSGPRVGADIVLTTGTGQISIDLEEDSDFTLRAETKVGSIHSSKDLTREVKGAGMQVAATFGQGTHSLQAEVGTGSIWVNTNQMPENNVEAPPAQP